MRPTITMKLLAAALLAATPLASHADGGLRIPFTGSLTGGGSPIFPIILPPPRLPPPRSSTPTTGATRSTHVARAKRFS